MAEKKPDRIVARVAWAMHSAVVAAGIEVDIEDFFPGLDPLNREGFVTIEQQRRFAQFIFNQPDDLIGLKFGSNVLFEGLGMVGFLFRSSPTFAEYLHRADRFHRVYTRDPEFVLESRGPDRAMVFPEPHADIGPRDQVVIGRMSKWITWGRQLCRRNLSPREVRFKWRGPKQRQAVADFFNCEIRYGQDEDCLLFDAASFTIPLRDHTGEMSQELEQYAQALVEKLRDGESFLAAVRVAIEDSIAGDADSEAVVASRMALTTRTLHRRLKREGTTFRELRDLILQQHAMALLRRPSVPLGEISFVLGYSEPSTFGRAFKRWTGTTPAQWRARIT
ncbi:MAG TPA: AraC family transcriptional regulator ligand-binding domain-containing protein [Gammaproteobacteria bacterium]|nr:AraC family transcriptional regulator ligand-binding domain-containing protein [Gammaproteobacteria bacterium]